MDLMPFFKVRQTAIVLLVIVILAILVAAYLITKGKPQTPISQAPPLTISKAGYKCPSIKDFCTHGKDIIKDKTYAGFGGKVATGSAVLASFEGRVTGLTITLPPQFNNEKLNVIYLDNKQKGIRAIYYFKGQPVNFNDLAVQEGAILGKIGDEISYYDQAALVFSIISGDPQKGEKIRVTAKDFN